jgi:hypothetical protein
MTRPPKPITNSSNLNADVPHAPDGKKKIDLRIHNSIRTATYIQA